ncbi:hypothetical protein [Gimesia sp.]|uniref:hypothetical protein n=1 Tax=Gimesia sp. TaxID=2024833 RepID=UPI000C67FED9|nr:hypothetical protein [Gimesia sp.]MAX38074.1 hypothetical protein [Gimesia sp.]HAH46255.1 hypothetical protein [Planctomycetaceae bacterium]HBL45482.1 hypothetical protein [Planctomycetaceae bacterium]
MIKNIRECIIVLIFILLLPILVPFSLLKNQLEKRKRGQLASRFVCLECGNMIGVEAIRLADERWSEIVKIIMSKSDPGIRLRLVRTVDAICPHCCCQYRFRETEQTFVVREVSPEWERLEPKQDSE